MVIWKSVTKYWSDQWWHLGYGNEFLPRIWNRFWSIKWLMFSLPFRVTSDEADIIQGKYPVVTLSLITWLNWVVLTPPALASPLLGFWHLLLFFHVVLDCPQWHCYLDGELVPLLSFRCWYWCCSVVVWFLSPSTRWVKLFGVLAVPYFSPFTKYVVLTHPSGYYPFCFKDARTVLFQGLH